MNEEHAILMSEVRYAERLCQRTARLYRRLQSVGTFVSVITGSATLTALSNHFPGWLAAAGGALFALTGALILTVRPAEKAAANGSDMKRYAKLRTDGVGMDAATLRVALARAHESDTAEVEPLRAVAFNDVVTESGRDDARMPLNVVQTLLSAIA